jgi:DNA-binding XRE family transcriptional regulator
VPRASTKKAGRWRSDARSDPETLRTFKKLGLRIRELRAEKALTQEQLAEGAALSVQHLLDLEHGRSNPTLASLVGIARGLGVSLPDLFR